MAKLIQFMLSYIISFLILTLHYGYLFCLTFARPVTLRFVSDLLHIGGIIKWLSDIVTLLLSVMGVFGCDFILSHSQTIIIK